MTAETYISIAADVLKRCSGYDLWFPTPSQTAIVAWANLFAESRLSREDLLAGVDLAYTREAPGYRPLPASIIRYAHTAYYEALRDLPDDQRELMNEASYALQDMGFSPNESHRYSRAIALGRPTDLTLTDEQDTQLRARLTTTKKRLDQPPRQLQPLWKTLTSHPANGPEKAFTTPSPTNGGEAA
ncbi:hypothetical protein [Nocardia farcinica]|uniref:hypothetical protein n=1 Tax=Nocardia farcinica TaxID=37329 RepID=UPI0024539268|nr:hypothetical protein [Nocardia farcinica]